MLPLSTTPRTQITWSGLQGWLDTALLLAARRASSLRKDQLRSHVKVLTRPIIDESADAALLARCKSLLIAGDFARPPRGQRATAHHTPLIVAIDNRLRALSKGGHS